MFLRWSRAPGKTLALLLLAAGFGAGERTGDGDNIFPQRHRVDYRTLANGAGVGDDSHPQPHQRLAGTAA